MNSKYILAGHNISAMRKTIEIDLLLLFYIQQVNVELNIFRICQVCATDLKEKKNPANKLFTVKRSINT